MFLPKLAIVLESCERAIILQQIHWLLRQPKSGVTVDGMHWVWGSYPEWCEDYFPMWKPQNLAKHIRKLEELGVLISCELNAKAHDHTKHYRINYEHERLQPIIYSSIVSEEYSSTPSVTYGNTQSINRTETYTENSAKSKKRATRTHPNKGERKTGYRPDDLADIILG